MIISIGARWGRRFKQSDEAQSFIDYYKVPRYVLINLISKFNWLEMKPKAQLRLLWRDSWEYSRGGLYGLRTLWNMPSCTGRRPTAAPEPDPSPARPIFAGLDRSGSPVPTATKSSNPAPSLDDTKFPRNPQDRNVPKVRKRKLEEYKDVRPKHDQENNSSGDEFGDDLDDGTVAGSKRAHVRKHAKSNAHDNSKDAATDTSSPPSAAPAPALSALLTPDTALEHFFPASDLLIPALDVFAPAHEVSSGSLEIFSPSSGTSSSAPESPTLVASPATTNTSLASSPGRASPSPSCSTRNGMPSDPVTTPASSAPVSASLSSILAISHILVAGSLVFSALLMSASPSPLPWPSNAAAAESSSPECKVSRKRKSPLVHGSISRVEVDLPQPPTTVQSTGESKNCSHENVPSASSSSISTAIIDSSTPSIPHATGDVIGESAVAPTEPEVTDTNSLSSSPSPLATTNTSITSAAAVIPRDVKDVIEQAPAVQPTEEENAHTDTPPSSPAPTTDAPTASTIPSIPEDFETTGKEASITLPMSDLQSHIELDSLFASSATDSTATTPPALSDVVDAAEVAIALKPIEPCADEKPDLKTSPSSSPDTSITTSTITPSAINPTAPSTSHNAGSTAHEATNVRRSDLQAAHTHLASSLTSSYSIFIPAAAPTLSSRHTVEAAAQQKSHPPSTEMSATGNGDSEAMDFQESTGTITLPTSIPPPPPPHSLPPSPLPSSSVTQASLPASIAKSTDLDNLPDYEEVGQAISKPVNNTEVVMTEADTSVYQPALYRSAARPMPEAFQFWEDMDVDKEAETSVQQGSEMVIDGRGTVSDDIYQSVEEDTMEDVSEIDTASRQYADEEPIDIDSESCLPASRQEAPSPLTSRPQSSDYPQSSRNRGHAPSPSPPSCDRGRRSHRCRSRSPDRERRSTSPGRPRPSASSRYRSRTPPRSSQSPPLPSPRAVQKAEEFLSSLQPGPSNSESPLLPSLPPAESVIKVDDKARKAIQDSINSVSTKFTPWGGDSPALKPMRDTASEIGDDSEDEGEAEKKDKKRKDDTESKSQPKRSMKLDVNAKPLPALPSVFASPRRASESCHDETAPRFSTSTLWDGLMSADPNLDPSGLAESMNRARLGNTEASSTFRHQSETHRRADEGEKIQGKGKAREKDEKKKDDDGGSGKKD